MGNGNSKGETDATGGLIIGRLPGIGEGTRKHAPARLPPNTTKTQPDDWPQIEVRRNSDASEHRKKPLNLSEIQQHHSSQFVTTGMLGEAPSFRQARACG